MITRTGLGIAAGLGIVVQAGFAQRASAEWLAFSGDSPKQCWAVASPDAGKSTATRDGRPVAVTRGDIFLFVSFWAAGSQGGGGMGEVSFMGGYDFADGQPVVLQIGDQKFDLFPEGNTAWATSPEEDRKITAAMKAGASAQLTAVSARSGTTTQDQFSLIGFTAAYDDAQKRCAK